MKVVAARADAIITDSDYSRREIERYLPASRQKTHRIWVGIAETFFTPAEPGAVGPCLAKARVSDGFILYYGGFAEHKNVDLLLRAFALLRKTRKQRLVLVGAAGRSTGGGLDRTVDALGISDSTTVFGFASEAELKILLDNCSLFVCPSAHEGFGLPVAEAMARGAPVVCSTHGSLPEIAGDAVVYFEGADAETLASAMKKVLDDEDLRNCMRKDGPARAQHFRWGAVIPELAELYVKLIAEQRRADRRGR